MKKAHTQQFAQTWDTFQRFSLQELYLLRAHYANQQGKLGNIPLISSTVPLLFLIFGGHVTKYLPSHNFWWLLVLILTIVVITFSLNYHFHLKGQTAGIIYLLDLTIRQKEQDSVITAHTQRL